MSHVALLRAVNVGGRIVKMERLRRLFSDLGFRDVATLIASGNVLFTPGRQQPAALERRIEQSLAETFGFEVTTFVRTSADLSAITAAEVMTAAAGESVLVGFLKVAPDAAAQARVAALGTPNDELQVVGREAWWLRRGRISDSRLSGGTLEKALGTPMTMRNITTVRKLALLLAERRG
ncbi:MAG: DUF1697 domain-containing protein [Gemmatimonadales bacterium]